MDFKMLKIDIRSVLLGMKNGATLKQFHNEYETRIGARIPVEKHGYRNVVDLIKNIPDVATLDNSDGEWRVYAVADENTAHIAQMVSKQKVSNFMNQ